MNEKSTLSKEDRTFLLKMFMISEMSTLAYRHLARNPDILAEMEGGDSNRFMNEFVKSQTTESGEVVQTEYIERRVLDKILQVIRTSPKTSEISLPLSEVFNLIGFFEEEREEVSEFNSLAVGNPTEALNFLSGIEWNFGPRVRSLIAEILQNTGQLKFDPDSADENQKKLLDGFRDRTRTALLVFEKYSEKEDFRKTVEETSQKFFGALLGVGGFLPKALGDLETNFLNDALRLASQDFWQKLMSLPKYVDWTTLDPTIRGLDSGKLIRSKSVGPVFNKLFELLPNNFDAVISLVKDLGLLKAASTTNFKKQLADFFVAQTDVARRNGLFDLFGGDIKTLEEYPIILYDILAKSEYAKVKGMLADNSLRAVLFSKGPKELREFIAKTADFNNTEFFTVFDTLWNQQYISELQMLESDFLTSLGGKINQVSDVGLQQKYVDKLISSDLEEVILKSGAQNTYIELLDIIKLNLSPAYKGKVTRFQNKLRGKQKGGGSRGRKRRKASKRK